MAAVAIPRNLPVGYRFQPTDEEFIDHYLKNRVLGFVDRPCVIPDVDICSWDPWELPPRFHGESIIPPDDKVQEWWFFCLQTPQQVKRSTPSGYWKKTGSDRNVKARDTDRVIGTKKTLVFHKGRGSKGINTKWVIHEYHLLANDLNRNYVLSCLKHTRDEKADNSTMELAHGAISLADLDSDLHQPDHEGSFPEPLVQAMMNSLIEPQFRPNNRVQVASPDLLQLLQPAPRSQNSLPSDLLQFMNIESPSFMDVSYQAGITDESIQLESLFGTSEEDEDFGDMLDEDIFDEVEDVEVLSEDLFYDGFFVGDQMETQHVQTSNSHDERPVVMENRQTRTISVHGVVPLENKKGMVENKFNSPLVALERPMAPFMHAASVKYCSKNEEPRSEKVKQETAVKNIKPERMILDEAAAKAKNGKLTTTENRQTRKIESLCSVVPLEQKKGVIQSISNSLHVSSPKPMEFSEKQMTPNMHNSPKTYINSELRFEKDKKQVIALSYVKTECLSLDESAAKAKVKEAPSVLKYTEHGSASDSMRKTNRREIEHGREKSNSVTALTRPTTQSTKSSTNSPLPNLVNVLVAIFLLFAITGQVFDI